MSMRPGGGPCIGRRSSFLLYYNTSGTPRVGGRPHQLESPSSGSDGRQTRWTLPACGFPLIWVNQAVTGVDSSMSVRFSLTAALAAPPLLSEASTVSEPDCLISLS